MKRVNSNIILFLLIAALPFACTKVVNINLNDSSPRLIIESSISDQNSSCIVKLSLSVNYNETNVFPPVRGASVVLSDDSGKSFVLDETQPGIYTLQTIKGVPGKTYSLSINVSGKSYEATSKMPQAVPIDSIYQAKILRGAYMGGGEFKYVVVKYRDPVGSGNYYRFVEKINKNIQNSIYLDDDMLRDGSMIAQNIMRADSSLRTGDSVRIYLQTIDKNVFDYFLQLRDVTNSFGASSATPANPISNFSGGALGYFSAYTVRSRSIVIK
jgi:hypothetical protein